MSLNRLVSYCKEFFSSRDERPTFFPSEQYLYEFKKTDVKHLLSANDVLLKEAAHVLQIDSNTYKEVLLPIFEYLAKYCLLLPASRHYHHKEAGSFFYHLVETANIAATKSTGRPDLMHNVPLEERVIYEVVNPMAAWVMGLLHDIAKPMNDFDILLYSRFKRHVNQSSPWRPDEETLYDYNVRHGASYYQVLYHTDKSYHLHQHQQMLYIHKMLSFFPVESKYRTRLKELLPAAVSISHPLNKLVKEADRESTKRDTLRYKPYPVVKNWAKAFIDVFQEYDRIKRLSDAHSLPYFFSSMGIHITYPNGFRRLLTYVQQRYQDAQGERMPVEPDAWVILLGTEHSVLIPNHASNSFHNPKYEDIKHFVYDVVVEPETDGEVIRVITLSYETVFLGQSAKTLYKDVRFATSISPQQPTSKCKTEGKEEVLAPSPKAENPDNEKPDAPLSEQFNDEPEEQPNPSHELVDNGPVTEFSEEALAALSGYSISEDDDDNSDPDNLDDSIDLSTNSKTDIPAQTEETLQSSTLDDDAFTPLKPVLNVKIHDPNYALHDFVSQIPEDHVISALANSMPVFEKNHAVISWLLFIFNDINQHSFEELTNPGLNYGFSSSGFCVNQAYLSDATTDFCVKYELTNATTLCIKNAIKDMDKKTSEHTLLFSGVNGRKRVFTPLLTKAMLYRYKDQLIPLLEANTITLGASNER